LGAFLWLKFLGKNERKEGKVPNSPSFKSRFLEKEIEKLFITLTNVMKIFKRKTIRKLFFSKKMIIF
jgi:hypothetical protein